MCVATIPALVRHQRPGRRSNPSTAFFFIYTATTEFYTSFSGRGSNGRLSSPTTSAVGAK